MFVFVPVRFRKLQKVTEEVDIPYFNYIQFVSLVYHNQNLEVRSKKFYRNKRSSISAFFGLRHVQTTLLEAYRYSVHVFDLAGYKSKCPTFAACAGCSVGWSFQFFPTSLSPLEDLAEPLQNLANFLVHFRSGTNTKDDEDKGSWKAVFQPPL